MIGELRLHRDGYGFVTSGQPDQADVFIPARYVGDALHTDVVEASIIPSRGEKFEGRILRIVERRVLTLMGRFERLGRVCQVVADDRRVRHRITIPDDALGGAHHNDNVIVRIREYPQEDNPMIGEVVTVLGRRGEEATEKAAVIARHQLERAFPKRVEHEAREVSEHMDDMRKGREDLTHIPFVTIDGETAKDFDDAVAVERIQNDHIRLRVSIADVSAFVRPQTVLDAEAYARATSVYFPGDCLPMLPEVLSNGVCSLKPDEDRLTLTAELDIAPDGEVRRSRFYRSIIRSHARMTYTAMKRILVEKDAAQRRAYADRLDDFELMQDCFERLRRSRLKRGSIDFDLPEPEIVIDMQGEIEDIVRAERHIGHMMIEEFMIAANEAVARFLTKSGAGCLYRVHDSPSEEKISAFATLVHNVGIRFRPRADLPPGDLADVVRRAHGRPEERLINHMLLRSMSQAVYSAENGGHYGLASTCYCHFTSPIRRYPDLIVHRLLIQRLAQKGRKHTRPRDHETTRPRELEEMAIHCSRRERIAVEAEREMAKLYAAKFIQGHIGDEFDGIISHVTKFGFFVELIDYFVEGLVHISSLDDDQYQLSDNGLELVGRRSKRRYRVGESVRIEVEEVDMPNREILFLLV